MRKTLSTSTLLDNAVNTIKNDMELSNETVATSPKAERIWRAIRMLKEEGKNFITGDVFILCNDISFDYVKKFVVSLYFRGIITRISKSVGTKPAVYALEKDEKPDPLYVPPYVYRRLIRSKTEEAVKEPQSAPPVKNPEKSDTSGDTSKPDKTATKHTADDIKMAQYILRGYHEDLASKVQRLNLFIHKIWEDRKIDNIQEGVLLLDLIGETLKLYFTKTAQVEREEITLQKLAEIYRPELSDEDKAGWRQFLKREREQSHFSQAIEEE